MPKYTRITKQHNVVNGLEFDHTDAERVRGWRHRKAPFTCAWCGTPDVCAGCNQCWAQWSQGESHEHAFPVWVGEAR